MPLDSDNDGYTDAQEILLGTDPFTYCGIMRADVDHDGVVSIIDITLVGDHFGETVTPALARLNQGPTFDSTISIIDIATMGSYFNEPVTDCP